MRFAPLLRALLAVCLVFSLKPAFSAPFALELAPTKVQIGAENTIYLHYQEECGSAFAGFVARTNSKGELQIAVALKRSHTRCLHLPGLQKLRVPELNAASFTRISAISPSTEALHFKSSPIQALYHVSKTGQRSTQIVYTSQCGSEVGLLMLPLVTGLHLSVLEGRANKFGTCNRESKIYDAERFDFTAVKYSLQSSFDGGDFVPSYRLMQSPTRLMQNEDSSHGYDVYYLRNCNEAPVGLVRQQTDKGLQVSMLVARYSEVSCSKLSVAKKWTAWHDRIANEEGQVITTYWPEDNQELTLLRPLSYRLETNARQPQMQITSYKACAAELGLVSRSSALGYAVGILQIQNKLSCISPLKQVTYSYDWKFSKAIQSDVKPLQLIGS